MHAKKITQKPDCMPISPGVPITSGSTLCCVTRGRTEDKYRYEDDIAEEVKKHRWATLLTTTYV